MLPLALLDVKLPGVIPIDVAPLVAQLNVLDPLTEMLAGLAVNEVIDGSGAPATVTVAVAITEPAELVAVNV